MTRACWASIRRGLLTLLLLSMWPWTAAAQTGPEARLLRIDPRAAAVENAPHLLTLIELVEVTPLNSLSAACGTLDRSLELDCLAERLTQPRALYRPFELPAEQATLTVMVDGRQQPARMIERSTWGEQRQARGIGTAWLIVIDASSQMGSRFERAKRVAKSFTKRLAPHDIVQLVFLNDHDIALTSPWLKKGRLADDFMGEVRSTYPKGGQEKMLPGLVERAVRHAFGGAERKRSEPEMPLHQAVLLLSDGNVGSGGDGSDRRGTDLEHFLSSGRFAEPKAPALHRPLPMISIWLPNKGSAERLASARKFMTSIANAEMGGGFFVVPASAARFGERIAQAVRDRFDAMHLVTWRVPCLEAGDLQTFELTFEGVDPPLAGDRCEACSLGHDPHLWPLDIDHSKTVDYATKHPIRPGGQLKIFGRFCWEGQHERAQLLVLRDDQQAPLSLEGRSAEEVKRAREVLAQRGHPRDAEASSDTMVVFELPANVEVTAAAGDQPTVRVLVFDTKLGRSSPLTADSILTLPVQQAPFQRWILGVMFLAGALLLVIVVAVGRRRAAPPRRRGSKAPQQASEPAAGPGNTPAVVDSLAPEGRGLILRGKDRSHPVVVDHIMKVGRDPSTCSICLSEPRVSTLHASLKLVDGTLHVMDEGSNNGTYLAGARIVSYAWVPAKLGDQLCFGPEQFTIEAG